jgi:hypothetical protein
MIEMFMFEMFMFEMFMYEMFMFHDGRSGREKRTDQPTNELSYRGAYSRLKKYLLI